MSEVMSVSWDEISSIHSSLSVVKFVFLPMLS